MTIRKISVIVGVIAALFNSSCQKKFNKHIELTGRIFHLSSQQPLDNTLIYLMADDATSAKNSTQASIELTSGTTGADGSFSLKCKAAKSGVYYLYVVRNGGKYNAEPNGQKSLSISDNSTKDLGDVLVNW